MKPSIYTGLMCFLFSVSSVVLIVGCGKEPKPEPKPEVTQGKLPANPLDGIDTKTGATFQRENTRINALAFSPDGKLLATGGHEKVVLFDLATGKESGSLEGDKDTERDGVIAFSSDGKTVAVESEKSFIKIWNLETKKEKTKYQSSGVLNQLCFSADGKTLYGNNARAWSVADGKEQPPLVEKQSSCVFSPGCECVAANEGYNPTIVRVIEITTGKKIAELKNEDGTAAAVSYPAKLFLSQLDDRDSNNRKLSVRDFTGKKTADVPGLLPSTMLVTPSHDGKYLAMIQEGDKAATTLRIFEFATGKELAAIKPVSPYGGSSDFYSVTFSHDDKYLAAGQEGGRIKVWKTEAVLAK